LTEIANPLQLAGEPLQVADFPLYGCQVLGCNTINLCAVLLFV